MNEKRDVDILKELLEKDEPSKVGEALGDDVDYDGGAGETTIGSSIYISSRGISSVDTRSKLTLKITQMMSSMVNFYHSRFLWNSQSSDQAMSGQNKIRILTNHLGHHQQQCPDLKHFHP